jgi:comEA protein
MNNWNEVWGGDGGDMASDPSDSLVWYGEYVYLNIFRNTSGGATSDIRNDYICGRFFTDTGGWQWKPAPFTITDARNQNALFIAPFELDRNDPNRLLGGALSLWRTDDAKTPNSIAPPGGPSWDVIKPPIGNNRRQHSISAIAIADGNSDIVVVGHANGAIFRSTDAAAANPNWQRIDNNGINASRQCLAITIDPDDHDVIYTTFGGFQSGNLWRSSDGGQSWADLSGNLPDAPIYDMTIHPQRNTWLYVATQVGVFASEDGGATWSPANEGPANVSCRDFFWMGSKLVCVTHGRGMFEIDLLIANAFPAPVLVYTGSEDYVVEGNGFTRYRLSISNRNAYPDSLFRPSPDLPPCGQNASASRTWVDIFNGDTNQRIYGFCALSTADDLDRLWFALPKGDPAPGRVYVVLRDRRCPATYQSNAVNIAFGTRININSASAQEFEVLPAIGPELAQRIVDHRQQHGEFATIEEIMNVSGIGPGRYEDIEELITVQ